MIVRSPSVRIVVALCVSLGAGPSAAQQSGAPVDAAMVILRDDYAPFTALLHLGADPYPDAVCSDSYTYTVGAQTNRLRRLYVRPNLGPTNPFGWVVNLWEYGEPAASAAPEQYVGVGDLDGDGDDDVAFAYGSVLRAYTMNGYNYLSGQAWSPFALPGPVASLAIGDFAGDGRKEVAVLAGGTLSILEFAGSTWTTLGQASLASGATATLVTADVDGVGSADLVVVDDASVVLVPVVAGVPQIGASFAHGAAMPMPAAGDVDGDGDEDVVVFDMATYEVFRRTGPSTFVPEPPQVGGPATNLADVDGDGDLDGVCCGGGGPVAPPNAVPSPFRVSRNDGSGGFAPAFEIPGIGAEHIAGAADMDDDGDVDLVGGRCIYYARGPILSYPAPADDTDSASSPNGARLADLDGDGDPDHAAACPDVLLNDGAGGFGGAQRLMTPPLAGHRYVGPGYPIDVDGDGAEDVVVELWNGPTFVEMRTLRNVAAHFFDVGAAAAPATRFDPAGVVSAKASLAGDIDGDGDQDLVVRSVSGPYQSRIWTNAGGVFTLGLVLPTDVVVYVGDLTVDGVPDLLVSHGDLEIRVGLGSGAFAAPHSLVSLGLPALVSASSFDPYRDVLAVHEIDPAYAGPGGSAPDILVVDRGGFIVSPTVSWDRFAVLRNLTPQGNPGYFSNFYLTYSYGEIDPSHPGPRRVLLADVDANGSTDVLYSPVRYDRDATRVHSFNSFGTTDGGSYQVYTADALADIDGDGDADVLGPRTLRNHTFTGASAGLRRQYGAGLAGTAGIVPTLGGVGPFRPGILCETRLTGGLGGAFAIYAFGNQSANLPLLGGTLLTNAQAVLAVPLGGTAGTPGGGEASILWTAPASLAGYSFYKQFGIVDPAAPQGIALSNGCLVTVGQ